jgi:hypothetical protein
MSAAATTRVQIYGAWHWSNDACLWGSVRDMTDFDRANHLLIDRGDGRPSMTPFVTSATPNVGTTSGMLGYMFWAAERPSTRGVTTAPPNTCEGGAGATRLNVPVPMPALRRS